MAGDGDETPRGKSLYSIIIPAAVALIVALITVFTTERQLEVDRHDLVIQEQRHRLEHQQRLDALLAQWLPGVLNAEDDEARRNALGYLRTRLHAEERELVFKVLVDMKYDAAVGVDLQTELQEARADMRGTGGWVIAAGAFADFANATARLRELEQEGRSGIIYDGRLFHVVHTEFDTRVDAEARLTSVQAFVEPDAYVITVQGLAAETVNVIPELAGLEVEPATDRLRHAGFHRRPTIAGTRDGVVTSVSIRHDPATSLDGTVDVPISDGATVVITTASAETRFVLTMS